MMIQTKPFDAPLSLQREYTRLLTAFSRKVAADVRAAVLPRVGQIKRQFDRELRGDEWDEDLNEIMVALAALSLAAALAVIDKLLPLFRATAGFNERQFAKAVRLALGVTLPPVTTGAPTRFNPRGINPFRGEPFIKPLMAGWISENTALIKSIPVQLHGDIEKIIRRGVMRGDSVQDIQAAIKARFPITNRRAAIIAQDQITKLDSQLTQYRLQSIGVESYVWQTRGDARVRDSHRARSGKVYRWDKPPVDGDHPGREPNCRCVAVPQFQNLA